MTGFASPVAAAMIATEMQNAGTWSARLPLLAIALGCGCGGGPAGGPAGGNDGPLPVADAGPDARLPVFEGIDILFVINDSLAIEPLQARLGDQMAGFFAALAAADGAAPSLHVGVVSTTVEEPVVGGALCRGTAGGELRPGDCITDNTGFASTATVNYAGSVAEAAACMMQLGSQGCGFEQPLEAMRRALDGARPGNAGFLRAGALLVVVFLTDEDDCSSSDPNLYNPSASQYGGFGSFRCFAHGVRCDQADPEALGPHTGCVATDDGVMFPIGEYAAFLDGLKGGPGRVVIGGLVPPAGPVVVGQDDVDATRRLLNELCSEGMDYLQTWPSIRMHALAREFNAAVEAPIGSMCDEDWSVPMTALAQQIADVYLE